MTNLAITARQKQGSLPALQALAEESAKTGRMLVRSLVSRFVFLASTRYGGPIDVNEETSWVEVGTDFCRAHFFHEVEGRWGIEMADSDRERIQTVGDLIEFVTEHFR